MLACADLGVAGTLLFRDPGPQWWDSGHWQQGWGGGAVQELPSPSPPPPEWAHCPATHSALFAGLHQIYAQWVLQDL